MSAGNKLVVPGAEEMLQQHKEEIAEEFGINASPASRDVVTPKLLEDVKKTKNKKIKTNEDM